MLQKIAKTQHNFELQRGRTTTTTSRANCVHSLRTGLKKYKPEIFIVDFIFFRYLLFAFAASGDVVFVAVVFMLLLLVVSFRKLNVSCGSVRQASALVFSMEQYFLL